jgi:hypothetical protein
MEELPMRGLGTRVPVFLTKRVSAVFRKLDGSLDLIYPHQSLACLNIFKRSISQVGWNRIVYWGPDTSHRLLPAFYCHVHN